MANAAAMRGSYLEASALLEQAAEHATRAQAWRALASTMSNLGHSLLQGDAVRGIEQCREAARRFEELGIRDEQAGAAVNVAIGLLRHGDDAAALGVVSDSLATYAELGHEDGVSYCLDVVAAGILRRGDASSAGLLAALLTRYARTRARRHRPSSRALHEETLEELRRQLEPDDLAAALAAGEAVAPDEAVVLASELAERPLTTPPSSRPVDLA